MTTEDSAKLNELNEEQRFELLVASVSDYAIYMLDPQGHVISWNAGAQRFKGYPPHEIIGRHFSVFYTEEDRAAGLPAKALQKALDDNKFEAEGWRVRKDGGRFWASVVLHPIRDKAGKLIGFAKVTRDMTERKVEQEALRESEEQFRLLVQGVTDYAIYMLSPSGQITSWNVGAQRIKGYTRDEVINTHFSRFYTDEDRAARLPEQGLTTASATGRAEHEGWRVRKDGTRFWAHVVIDAVRDKQDRLIGFAKVTRDITEKKQAAEALERANAALFQSQKMEALGQLTGGVAHDFNNLLAVMSSSLDVLSMRLHNQSDRKLLEGMQRSVQRGAMLTQQLLSFARQQPLKVETCNINSLISGFEAVLRRAINSSIAFELRLAPALLAVSLDAARFEAALLNLLVNARDAMPDGGRLIIATENVQLGEHQVGSLAAGQYVKVAVADSGEGMPSHVLARAFEPFFTTKEIGKGTGLGLSQVYGFIAQSGGEVVLDSVVGQGTTVSIYLPALAVATNNTGTGTNIDTGVDTVLIVEDELDLMEVAAALFRSMGYEVLTAANGKHAVDILKRRNDINILFTDVMMPNGMSGIELARFTRQLRPATKIILASGYPRPALEAEHGELEGFTFMSKPYRLSELAKRLRAG